MVADNRFAKVELTRDECDAGAELAEIAVHLILKNQMFMKTRDQDTMRAAINSLRFKMSVAASLFGPSPNIVTAEKKGIILPSKH